MFPRAQTQMNVVSRRVALHALWILALAGFWPSGAFAQGQEKDRPKKPEGQAQEKEQPKKPDFKPAFEKAAVRLKEEARVDWRQIFTGEGRLGIRCGKVSPALADQLELAEGLGLLIEEVRPSSAAAKSGFKVNDVLIELDGKPVPSDSKKFDKAVKDVKADAPTGAVLLRKGKKTTVKDLILPASPQLKIDHWQGLGVPTGYGPFGGGGLIVTSVVRDGDRFLGRHQGDALVLAATGTIVDGKARISEIQVQEGFKSNKYEALDKVPEKHREHVKKLIELAEKSNIALE